MQLEIIDPNGNTRPYRPDSILAAGERLHVPHMLMDHAATRGERDMSFRTHFSDGSVDHTNPHQPGYRFADTNDEGRRAAAEAYEQRRARMQDAWQRKGSEEQGDTTPPTLDAARSLADAAYAAKVARMTSAWKSR
jgi:galactokinase